MLKNTTYQQKFAILKPWLPVILETVKKDLRNEHLKKDVSFCRKYLAGKNLNKLAMEDLVSAYMAAIEGNDNAEQLAEFVSNRWLLKHSDVYDYFEHELSVINPDFSAIDEIDLANSQKIVDGAVKKFGAVQTYLFSIMNSVVFPDQVLGSLGKNAADELQQNAAEKIQQNEQQNAQMTKAQYEMQIARLTDKYEKKIQGLQKLYQQDVASLKKQISNLQKKIQQN
jgi:hypothetical protein